MYCFKSHQGWVDPIFLLTTILKQTYVFRVSTSDNSQTYFYALDK